MARFVKVGSAWCKVSKQNNKEFLSCSVKSKDTEYFLDKNPKTGNQTKTKLYLQINEDEPVLVSSLSVFPNEVDKDKFPNAPDFSLLVALED